MQHIHLTCKNHPNLRWQVKSVAVNPDGSYNGLRNIFYNGDVNTGTGLECPCSATDLTFADENERQRWCEDHTVS